MRHGKKIKKLGRTSAHRKATMAALSNALIEHKRITTTFEKAKALRGYVEPLINRAKSDTVHNRRQVFRYLQDKDSVTTLFGEVAEKIADRPGGYTRVVKLGRRQGDGAEVALIELVDYNDIKPEGSGGSGARKKTRRGSRRAKSTAGAAATAAVTAADVAEDLEADVQETAADVAEEVTETAEENVEVVKDVIDLAEEAPDSGTVATVEEAVAAVEAPEAELETAEGPAVVEDETEDDEAAEEEDEEKK